MKLEELNNRLKEYGSKEKAEIYQRFFKTGKGEYGEGDVFFGLNMGENRLLSKQFKDLGLDEIQTLLNDKIHEKRMIGLLILVGRFNKSKTEEDKEKIYNFYLKNSKRINNWDLVDLTAPNIVGKHLLDKDRKILYNLAESENLWERRISILSCFPFIKKNDFEDCLRISKKLFKDKQDLIHKAVGWMLRESWKINPKVIEGFIIENYKDIPRTALRYAIERFEEDKRKRFLEGLFK